MLNCSRLSGFRTVYKRPVGWHLAGRLSLRWQRSAVLCCSVTRIWKCESSKTDGEKSIPSQSHVKSKVICWEIKVFLNKNVIFILNSYVHPLSNTGGQNYSVNAHISEKLLVVVSMRTSLENWNVTSDKNIHCICTCHYSWSSANLLKTFSRVILGLIYNLGV